MLLKVLGIVGAALLTGLASYLLGRAALSRLPGVVRTAAPSELRVFALAVGAVSLSAATFAICALGWLYDAVLVALVAAAAALWYLYGRNPSRAPELEKPTLSWLLAASVAAAPFFVLYLINALAPEHEHDALGYHLGQIARFRREHGFAHITSNLHAFMPKGAEMLYLFAFSFGRESAAKLMHFALLLLTCAGVVVLGRRLGSWRGALVGALFFASTPVVGRDATSVYVDVALACFHWFTFHSLVLWWKTREDQWLAVVGLVAGFCFAIKYTGGLVVVAAVIAVLALRRSEPRRALGNAVTVGLFAALSIIPWTAKTYLDTGSPTAPMFTRLFENPYVTPRWEDSFKDFVRYYRYEDEDRSWKTSPVQIAREMAFDGGKAQGLLGPAYLLAPLSLLAWRRKLLWALWIAAVISLVPWWMNATARFLIPGAVFVALAIGLAVEALRERWKLALACALVASQALPAWPSTRKDLFPNASFSLYEFPWRAALRIEEDWRYIAPRVPGYGVVKRLEKRTPPGTRILALDHLPEFHFHGEILFTIMSTEGFELTEELFKVIEVDLQPIRETKFVWPKRELNGVRLTLTNEWDTALRIAEIRLLSEGREIAAEESWTVRTSAYPWTAERMTDSDMQTIWRSWRARRPGQWLEVSLPRTVEAEGIALRVALGMHELMPEVSLADGEEWELVEAGKDEARLEVDTQILKDQAARALRASRIEYVVVNPDGDVYSKLLGPPIAEDPASWGLREVIHNGSYRVYEVQPSRSVESGAWLSPRSIHQRSHDFLVAGEKIQ